MLVHVAGAVVAPGSGAGRGRGPGGGRDRRRRAARCPTADLDRLNLAAKVADGQRILVERVGAPAAGTGASDATAGAGDTADGSGRRRRAAEPQHRDHRAISTRCPGSAPRSRRRSSASASDGVASRASISSETSAGIGEKRFADLKDLVTV